MTKVVVPDIDSGYNLTQINVALQQLANELNTKVLYRDNPVGEPNAMNSLLDMNSKQIINLPAPATQNSPARLQDVQSAIVGLAPASLVPFTPASGVSATTVQAAIEEVAGDVTALNSSLTASSGSNIVGFLPFGTGAITTRKLQAKVREVRKSVEDFGGIADGVTNNDSAIAAAALASGGRFHFPGPGTYVCSSSVWNHAFTAGDNVVLKVSGVDYVVSNAVAGPWRYTVDSPVLLSLRHAITGNIVQQWQNGASGTATYFYRGLSIQTDSHAIQMAPATNGGSVDLLFQRSVSNADSGGNRFNITFEENNDRLLFSFATTASGAPSFDTWMVPIAGITPSLTFPALKALFNQGFGIKQRAAGGFELEFVPTSSTVSVLRQVGGSGQTYMTFRDAAMGFFGSTGTSRITLPAAATDPTSTQTLVNAIRTALIAYGLTL